MKKTFSLLLAAAACVVPFTLSSCGGGGGKGDFAMTASQFASGNRGFSIMSQTGWEVWASGRSTNLIPGPAFSDAQAIVDGYITTSFSGNRAEIWTRMTYSYDAESNTGHLEYTWDATNVNNKGGEFTDGVTDWIYTSHEKGGAGSDDYNAPDIVTHFGRDYIDFDFNTGTCVYHCGGCGHTSQVLDFMIKYK